MLEYACFIMKSNYDYHTNNYLNNNNNNKYSQIMYL